MSKIESGIEIIARGVWIHEGKVLLCQNITAGYFYLPGGHVEFGESAAGALAREFEEETGQAVTVGHCAFITEVSFRAGKRFHHELNLVFLVEHLRTDIRSKEAQISFHWVDLAGLVELDVRPEAIKAWLASGGGNPRSTTWLSQMGNGPDQS